jgi:hypothetical protein
VTVTVLPKVVPVTDRVKVTPYVILAAIQCLDIATTWFILQAWSERAEGNPVARWFLESTGLEIGLLLMLALKLGVVYIFYACQTGVKLLSAFYSLVIINNLIFIGTWGWLVYKGQL